MVRWLSANWIWVVVVGGMLWMHLGMHRGHGGHGGRGGHGGNSGHAGHSGQAGHTPPGAADATAGESHRHRGC